MLHRIIDQYAWECLCVVQSARQVEAEPAMLRVLIADDDQGKALIVHIQIGVTHGFRVDRFQPAEPSRPAVAFARAATQPLNRLAHA